MKKDVILSTWKAPVETRNATCKNSNSTLRKKKLLTNVGKHFFNLIDKHSHKNYTLCIRCSAENCKVSYSCMGSMENIIKQHNVKVPYPKETDNFKRCNSRNKVECLLNGSCMYYPVEIFFVELKESNMGIFSQVVNCKTCKCI